ncbi:MAG: (d)CMP kinase [Planctomycetota bacterium]
MIVTIDGPAGAGKSSISRGIAESLGYDFLDTGAMYRAVTLGAIRKGIALTDVDALVAYVGEVTFDWEDDRIILDGEDVTGAIRSPEVTQSIRHLADPPLIRSQLSRQQRRVAEGRDIVTEGRDQGTEVFPDASCKIFLTASPEERARRRLSQLESAGHSATFDEILAAQNQRDLEDRLRPVGRLRAASDAKVIQTDGMSPSDVHEAVLSAVKKCIAEASIQAPATPTPVS